MDWKKQGAGTSGGWLAACLMVMTAAPVVAQDAADNAADCWRRPNFEPLCRLNIEPGKRAGPVFARCGDWLASVPALPRTRTATTTPAGPTRPVPTPAKQASDLELMVRDFVLPSIKLAWPDASMVVTGVEIVWAGKEFWDQASDEHADTTKTTIAGVRLASKVVGLYLGAQDAPPLAVGSNAIAGLLIATTDKMYSAKLKRA